MAHIIVCDGGCTRKSPDIYGRHIANNWLIIKVWKGSEQTSHPIRDIQICHECWADPLRIGKVLTQ